MDAPEHRARHGIRALHPADISFQDVAELSPGLIGIHELDGTIRYMNPAAGRALGYDPAELEGRNFADLLAASVRPFFLPAMERLRNERATEGLVTVVQKDGTERLWWYRNVLCERPGKPPCVLGDSSDVTDVRGADEALRESEERFRHLAENIHQVCSVRDPRTNELLYVNRAFETVWGLPRQRLFEQPLAFLETIHPEDRELVMGTFARSAQGQATEMEYRIVRPDGQQRWMRGRSFPVRDQRGEVTRVVGISEDITEQRRAEQALRAAKEAAEAAALAKSHFVAHVSHEVGTPLQVICGMAEMVRGTQLTAEQSELLGRIEAAAERLRTLAADLLDFSKIEARHIELRVAPFDLRRVIRESIEPFLGKAYEKGVALHAVVPEDLPITLVGDADRLRQVVTNLIGNAMKFTDSGEVIVGLEVVASEAESLRMGFSVRDTGIGIAPEERERVFEAFSQVYRATERDYGGSGLGLAICRELVQLMQGEIWVESEPGRGSVFHFTARFERVPAAPR